ncbi:MAG TPA: efflux RND transporter periplasmic adaptor subunit [Sandaracinaceae bacterium LLY-WYZ-13_1]|nr:efflux RND transporter periplasmic adaptor subunit [Sandaracinaceae bacterium LLY-WYZ-13_1]
MADDRPEPPALALDPRDPASEATPDERETGRDEAGDRPSGEADEEGSRLRRAMRVVAPLLVIAAGVGLVMLLRATAPTPAQEPATAEGALVEIARAAVHTAPPELHAQGTVRPARRSQLAPRVAGRVVWVSPRLIEGGRFDEGEPMLRVDPSDYELAVRGSRGQVEQARVGLMREESARTVAEETWELFDQRSAVPTATGRALASNEPQVEAAEAQLASARSQLRQARLNLSRTRLRAPYAAQVLEESVDEGQQVGPQAPVATVVGTDAYRVRVSVQVSALPALRIPPAGSGERGSPAVIRQELRGRAYTWEGYVGGLVPAVDDRGAMARVVVVVPDPLGLERPEGPREVPLLLGSFVDVTLRAEPLPDDVVRVPRAALRDGAEVWVATDDGALDIRAVEVAWRREDSVLLSSGIEPGDRVVVNRLAAPVDGMAVRIAEDDAPDGGAREASLR